jgi:hypothetical protein
MSPIIKNTIGGNMLLNNVAVKSENILSLCNFPIEVFKEGSFESENDKNKDGIRNLKCRNYRRRNSIT